jgi:ribonucleoside-diphosphate reductase alpha chain
MGLAELLASLRIPYDSDAAVRLAARIARHIRTEARRASGELAAERGPFPLFSESTFARNGAPALRNAQLTAVAPTGTVSLIAGTTAGIEPMFAIAYARTVLGHQVVETNPLFDRTARREGFHSDAMTAAIARTGSVRNIEAVPADIRAAFPTALDIAPAWHLRMQAAVQRHVDAAVSKTINLPAEATVGDVRAIFLGAWHAKAKGITVYRYGSKPDQVLTLIDDSRAGSTAPVQADAEYAGGCAGHVCEF